VSEPGPRHEAPARRATPPDGAPAPPSLAHLLRAFLVLGGTSFGGGVVAYLRQALVVRERWLDDETFLAGLELSQTLPGLNAVNMSVYVGARLRGVVGAIVAAAGMMLPGLVVVLALGVFYGEHGHRPWVAAALGGVGAAAVGLTVATTLRIGRRQLGVPKDLALVALTFVVVGLLRWSLVVALLVIGPLGVWLHRPRTPGAS